MKIKTGIFSRPTFLTFVLIFILACAAVLRLGFLGSWFGDGLNVDEALEGYEAYSLLETGADHRGHRWPIFFEGYSDRRDMRSAFYSYFTIPSVAIFGLNTYSIRLPAALIGVATVFFTYLLGFALFKKRGAGLLAATFLTFSPWHIFMSRFGAQYVTTPFFVAVAAWLFLKAIRGSRAATYLSGLGFGLALYGYSNLRIFIPATVVFLIIFFWKEIRNRKKDFILAAIIFILIGLPLFASQVVNWRLMQGRFDEVSIFANNGIYWPLIFLLNAINHIIILFWSNMFEGALIIFAAYLFLFKKNNHPRDFLMDNAVTRLLLVWAIAAILPAALTVPSPHVFRSNTFLPLVVLVAAEAAIILWDFLKHRIKLLYIQIPSVVFLFLAGACVGVLFFYSAYMEFYQFGWSGVTAFLDKNENDFSRVIITKKANQPYMYILFFKKYAPAKFLAEEPQRLYLSNGWQQVVSFGKYEFCEIEKCYDDLVRGDVLFVARGDELIPFGGEPVFSDIDGNVIFKALRSSAME